MKEALIHIRSLTITGPAKQVLVDNVSFKVFHDEILGIVGGSGSGKSLTMFAIGNLLAEKKLMIDLDLVWETGLAADQIGFVFQEPAAALNPVRSVGNQIKDALLSGGHTDTALIQSAILQLLDDLTFSNPSDTAESYPHQLSGGEQQRIVMALALARKPKLIIADEPTTALDDISEREVISLLTHLHEKLKIPIIIVSHDLDLVAQFANRIAVFYQGKIVELGQTDKILDSPEHEYTKRLIGFRQKKIYK